MHHDSSPRIALIHALSHSMAPINAQLQRDWPEAVCANLLDDRLSADLAQFGQGLDAAMHQRFHTLANYALGQGAQAILFTCSAFGPCIEAVAQQHPQLPVLKPNEAMVADATRLLANQAGGKLGLLATFKPTLESMPPEFPADMPLHLHWVEGALDALNAGDADRHDALIAQAAQQAAAAGCTAIALAQFSMARAQDFAAQQSQLPVLTTPASAVAALKARLLAGGVPR